MPIAWILTNWQLIAKAVGVAIVTFACWWFFIHNPKVIKGLEEDKAELKRQVVALEKAQTLYDDIKKARGPIDAAVQNQISSLRAEARPRRAVIIRAGVLLPPMHPANTTR